MIKWKTLMVWLSLLVSLSNGEFFTSLNRMKGLVRLESALSQSLDSYLEQISEAPEILRQFADHVRKERNVAAGDIEKYVFHPINSFQLVRRFVRHWKELESYLAKGSPNGKDLIVYNYSRTRNNKTTLLQLNGLDFKLYVASINMSRRNWIYKRDLHEGNSNFTLF